MSAFTGLGAPRWDMYARGAIVGLTRGSNKAHIARATLEGIAYQVKDLLDAMQDDAGEPLSSVLRVGRRRVRQFSFMMQFQADMLREPIDRPKLVETTAFGAAFLAGTCQRASGRDVGRHCRILRQSDRVFTPEMDAERGRPRCTKTGCAQLKEQQSGKNNGTGIGCRAQKNRAIHIRPQRPCNRVRPSELFRDHKSRARVHAASPRPSSARTISR